MLVEIEADAILDGRPASAMTAALYDSVIADFYDASPVVASRQKDVVFYRDAAQQYGGSVLELGCGTGRVTMAIAEAGQSKSPGLDNSEKMLAARHAKKLPRYAPNSASASHYCREICGVLRLSASSFSRSSFLFVRSSIFCPCRNSWIASAASVNISAPGGKLIMDFFQTDAARMHDPEFSERTFHRGI